MLSTQPSLLRFLVIVALAILNLQLAHARVIASPKARVSTVKSSSASSAAGRTARRQLRTTRAVRAPSATSSAVSIDLGEYNRLKALRDSMNKMLTLMQESGTDGYGQVFGTKNKSVLRLQEIPDEYARIVQSISICVERAGGKEALPDYVVVEIERQTAYAASLEKEFKEIIDRFHCTLQKNC